MLTLTESAQNAIRRFIQGSEEPVSGLRLAVVGGGCSGLQYSMNLVADKEAEDFEVTCGPVTVYVDPLSAPYLKGTTVDFLDGLEGSGFKFVNPNASHSCGCGSSFTA
jgi:iron-sulfur cluster assembly accessory protein